MSPARVGGHDVSAAVPLDDDVVGCERSHPAAGPLRLGQGVVRPCELRPPSLVVGLAVGSAPPGRWRPRGWATGIAATVVHGVCRDTATAARTGYPIWSAGRFMRTGKDRVRLAAVEQLLLIDGVTIAPGDLVCGDEDGVVVVPADRATEVAQLAADIEAAESQILAAVRS